MVDKGSRLTRRYLDVTAIATPGRDSRITLLRSSSFDNNRQRRYMHIRASFDDGVPTSSARTTSAPPASVDVFSRRLRRRRPSSSLFVVSLRRSSSSSLFESLSVVSVVNVADLLHRIGRESKLHFKTLHHRCLVQRIKDEPSHRTRVLKLFQHNGESI